MFLLFFDSVIWVTFLTLLYLQCIIPNCSAEGKGWPSVTRQWWYEDLKNLQVSQIPYLYKESQGFYSFSYFDISGLEGPSWQCWEPTLPALRVGLMINLLLSYRAITTFLLVNMEWIADLLCWNKLAFFLHSYIGYYLSKEVKRTQKDLGVYCGYHCTVCRDCQI